ncbi:MAG: SAM-dependent methyltransferase, partial [Spirochaetes bacterium]|nr:SAM-dependent methyltransferase [Spirochaetota bacterium]
MVKIKPFEEHTAQYEEWFEVNNFAYESELLAVKRMLPEKGIGMEIGVGSGRFAGPLGIQFGIEPSAKMREIAKKRGIDVVD